jgi:hypothetical protein
MFFYFFFGTGDRLQQPVYEFLDALKGMPPYERSRILEIVRMEVMGSSPKVNRVALRKTLEADEKRRNEAMQGRPALESTGRKIAPWKMVDVEGLIEFFMVPESKHESLRALAARALQISGTGIPPTRHPDCYDFVGRGGTAGKEDIPLVANPRRRGGNFVDRERFLETWAEFEVLLLGLDDERWFEHRTTWFNPAAAGQGEGGSEKQPWHLLKIHGIRWNEDQTEEGPAMGSAMVPAGVPKVPSWLARAVIHEYAMSERGRDFAFFTKRVITDLPLSLLEPGTRHFHPEFASALRRMFAGAGARDKKGDLLGRRARLALSRLLMTPINRLENKLYSIAFSSDDSPGPREADDQA